MSIEKKTDNKPTLGHEVAKNYRVTRPFWFGPRLMSEGDPLQLTDAQVKYRGSEIELIKPDQPARLSAGKRIKGEAGPQAQDEAAS